MPKKRSISEQIIVKLREAEVELAKGISIGQVCQKLGVAEPLQLHTQNPLNASKTNFEGGT
jgi:hypothetical protein